MSASRADICVVAVAECFRGDGEIVANPIGTIPRIGGLLARRSFEPDLVMTDGEAMFSDADGVVEAWNPYRSMFDVVWSGRRHVMMGGSQIDPFGNQNFAAIGDMKQPKSQLLGFRGAPGNTVNNVTSYWVPNHGPRVFVESVDVVTGVGYDRAAAAGSAATRYHGLRHVVTNLCVLDFDTPNHRMRLRSVHPGVSADEVVAATGFELVVPADVATSREPTEAELAIIAELDPKEHAQQGSPRLVPPRKRKGVSTRFTELVGIRYPIVQTGMGWVATPQLAAATSAAGGLGILAAATMTYDELSAAIKDVRERTDAPFGVNMRADQPDVGDRVELLIREGVRVASFAMAPKQDLISRLQDGGVLVMPSIGAKRHAEKVVSWGVDAVLVQGGEGGGHTGAVPTSLLLPQVVDAVGGQVPVVAAGGYFDGRGLVAALAYGASGVAMGTRFLLTSESPVPDAVKQHYLGKSVADTVVTKQVDGVPHRVLRSDLVDSLESASAARRFGGAIRNASRFRKDAGLTWRAMLREGAAMRKTQELSWSQVLMAGNTPMLLRAAMVDGRVDLGVMASGQVVGMIDDLPTCAELIDRIITEADQVLSELTK